MNRNSCIRHKLSTLVSANQGGLNHIDQEPILRGVVASSYIRQGFLEQLLHHDELTTEATGITPEILTMIACPSATV